MSNWENTSQMERIPTYIPITSRIPKIYTIAPVAAALGGGGTDDGGNSDDAPCGLYYGIELFFS